MSKESHKIQTSGYKINKSWGYNVTEWRLYYTVHLKIAKRINLKGSYHKKKFVIKYGDDVNQTYSGDHFAIYTIIHLKLNVMYQLYPNKNKYC